MTRPAQPLVLAPVPPAARYLFLDIVHGADPRSACAQLAALDPSTTAVGLGPALVARLGLDLPDLRPFPALDGPDGPLPRTPRHALVWVAGDDPGQALVRSLAILRALPSWTVAESVPAFVHAGGRDLSGFEDGTENPTGDDAADAALADGPPGVAGSSFAAVQRWVHDFDALAAMTDAEQSDAVGRDKTSNDELDDAPESAHVKRTEQEGFEPHAFVLRRSMPWADGGEAGLLFVAFGRTLDAFEVQMRRMIGQDDGIVDAIFRFTRPVTSATFWFPPVRDGRLDLRALDG